MTDVVNKIKYKNFLFLITLYVQYLPVPVAELSNAMVCDLSLTRIASSNAAGGVDVCLF